MGFNPIPNTKMASYERGFGDFTMKADMESIREINYIGDNRQILFFSDLYDQSTNKPITHAPRYMLRKAINELKEMGYDLEVQCDITFTAFFEKYKKLSENFGHAQTLTEHSNLYNTIYSMNMDEFLNKIKNSLKISGINVEKLSGHKAPGQYNISLPLSDGLEFCDNITILKLVFKKK
jgi:glutamine synthetase